MTAEEVKEALRRRHPCAGMYPGQWVCIEEWMEIDLLALNAWQKADVIGYEVKVSRPDYRRELLKPNKRKRAVEHTTEFYFAVPDGLLSDDEIAYDEPEWEPKDFQRERCPGHPTWGRCYKHRWAKKSWITVPHPPKTYEIGGNSNAVCPVCNGRGYIGKSKVELEAPTCWVPKDVGLIVVTDIGTHVVKKSPKRKDPKPLAHNRQYINHLVRYASRRPDPRHR